MSKVVQDKAQEIAYTIFKRAFKKEIRQIFAKFTSYLCVSNINHSLFQALNIQWATKTEQILGTSKLTSDFLIRQ